VNSGKQDVDFGFLIGPRAKMVATAQQVSGFYMEGAVLRVRPKAMTVAVIVAGLIPILLGTGTGSEVMQRIAAPMVGGMITAPLLSLFVIPAIYLLWQRRRRLGSPPGYNQVNF
jgi:Cu/Ag efflux pump CusA